MSRDDLDHFYEKATAQDPARPRLSVRQAIFDRARELAEQAQQRAAVEPQPARRTERTEELKDAAAAGLARWFTRHPWLGWQIGAPVAAAVVAALLLEPELRSTAPPSPTQALRSPSNQENGKRQSDTADETQAQAPSRVAQERAASTPFLAKPSARSPTVMAESAPAAPPAPKSPPSAAADLASNAQLAAADSGAAAARSQKALPTPRAEPQANPSAASEARVLATPQGEPLLQAATRGDMANVRALLRRSAVAINARDAEGRTALMLALLHHHAAVAQLLLEHGADANIADAAGHTALAIAMDDNDPAMIRALKRAGAR